NILYEILHTATPFSYLCIISHHILHSFPTRRSSDLDSDFARLSFTAAVTAVFQGKYIYMCAVEKFIGRCAVGDVGGVTVKSEKRDRKSTRLNSSHVSISYAVFCLKKKIYSAEQRSSK